MQSGEKPPASSIHMFVLTNQKGEYMYVHDEVDDVTILMMMMVVVVMLMKLMMMVVMMMMMTMMMVVVVVMMMATGMHTALSPINWLDGNSCRTYPLGKTSKFSNRSQSACCRRYGPDRPNLLMFMF